MEKMRGYFTLDNLPTGFRFRPTDEELINHYLKGKINGVPFDVDVIPEVDVCKCEPEELPAKSWIKSDDPEWFFFSRRDPISNKRSNRATKAGYWKPTGKDREIKSKLSRSKLIGMKKTLVFHRGRAPKGKGTGWIIHEYRIIEDGVNSARYGQAAFVLCRLCKGSDNKKFGSSNCNDIERSDLFSNTNNSSPDKTQHTGDSVEQIQMPLNQGIPPDVMLEDPQLSRLMAENDLLADLEHWLDQETDYEMSICPGLEGSQQYGMPSVVQGQNAEVAVAKEKDESSPLIREWLHAALSDNPEENYSIGSVKQKNSVPWVEEPYNMITHVPGPWESELDTSNESKNSFRMRPARGPKAAPLVGFVPKPVNITVTHGNENTRSLNNMGPIQNKNDGPNVSYVDNVFENIKEPSTKRSSDNSRVSGIRIRPRKLHRTASTQKFTPQGEAPRRIHLQRRHRVLWVSRKANDSSTDRKENQIKAAIYKVRRNVQDTGNACFDKLESLHHQVRDFSAAKLHKLELAGEAADHFASEFARKVSLHSAERGGREVKSSNKISKPYRAGCQTVQRSSEASQAGLSEIKHEDQSWDRYVTRQVEMPKVGNEPHNTWETGKHQDDYAPPMNKFNQLTEAHRRVGRKLNRFLEKHRGCKHRWAKVKVEKQ